MTEASATMMKCFVCEGCLSRGSNGDEIAQCGAFFDAMTSPAASMIGASRAARELFYSSRGRML